MEAANDNTAGDLLMGANAIAKHLGVTPRQIYRLTYSGELPTFKLGGAIAARRSTLLRWLAHAEQAARAA